MRKELKNFVLPSIVVAFGLSVLVVGLGQSNLDAADHGLSESPLAQTVVQHKCPSGYVHASSGKHRCVRQAPRGSH